MSGTTESTSFDDVEGSGAAQVATGISLIAFVTALAASLIVFGVQMGFFLLLRNKLVRILYVSIKLSWRLFVPRSLISA